MVLSIVITLSFNFSAANSSSQLRLTLCNQMQSFQTQDIPPRYSTNPENTFKKIEIDIQTSILARLLIQLNFFLKLSGSNWIQRCVEFFLLSITDAIVGYFSGLALKPIEESIGNPDQILRNHNMHLTCRRSGLMIIASVSRCMNYETMYHQLQFIIKAV